MLTTFIIICVVFCLIAMAAVALPLWFGGRKAADAEDRHETILGILRQQAADLEKEREAGRIDLDEYEESRLELERRVLEETARDTDAEVKDQSKVARIIAVVLAVVIPASAVFGYLALGRYNAMDPAFLEAVQNQQRQTQGHSQSDMMAAIERLQNRLKETPDDAQTWYMLARTLSNVGRFAEALDAFREVDRLVPNNADIIADMADMTAAANNKVITDEAVRFCNAPSRSIRASGRRSRSLPSTPGIMRSTPKPPPTGKSSSSCFPRTSATPSRSATTSTRPAASPAWIPQPVRLRPKPSRARASRPSRPPSPRLSPAA